MKTFVFVLICVYSSSVYASKDECENFPQRQKTTDFRNQLDFNAFNSSGKCSTRRVLSAFLKQNSSVSHNLFRVHPGFLVSVPIFAFATSELYNVWQDQKDVPQDEFLDLAYWF